MAENQYGKVSKLHMVAGLKEERTILEDVFFTMPFKVVKPFYDEDDRTQKSDEIQACGLLDTDSFKNRMKVMMISLSAGIMAGDTQKINIVLKEGSRMETISQSYEKIHKMDDGFAKRTTCIKQESDTVLFYNPLPTIPFADSAYTSDTCIELADDTARLIYEDIISCGRAACEERFQYRCYNNRLEIRCKGKLKYLDNTRYQPHVMDMEGYGMFEGYTHLMNLLLCNVRLPEEKGLAQIKNYLVENGICGGATKLDENWYCIKILGNSAQELQKYKGDILHKL